ncbi:DUF3791 domain-containing protein [Neisseria yangbaofengii]|uniref:DUF3791 domain-containing protein n=1 Tax=Neisseria yangbaofengii TaxID=2709396 RepID=UPI0013ECDCC6|nr:DUF3791 domain-containing protein [Neisseria yangbaofengii]
MNEETKFFIYLLENYAYAKKTNAAQILALWDSLNLTDLIFSQYPIYHIERLENAFDDIDQMILEKQRLSQHSN